MLLHRTAQSTLWVCLAATVTAIPLSAQDHEDVWRSTLELGFTGASGNTSFSILSAGASLTRLEQGRFELDLSVQVRWGKSDDEVIADDQQGTIKFDWIPEADLSPFVFATAARDVTRNLDRRLVGGGGAKWTFMRWGAESELSFSLAAVLDYENFDLAEGVLDPETSNVARWSSRLKLDHGFGSSAMFQHITFWQPRVTDAGDYVLSIENSLSSRLLSNLSLVINHSYIHDELPPPGAAPNDQRLAVVLRVSL